MNTFRNMLSTPPVLGLWQALANSYSAEICAGSGFDFLVVDCEHAPNTVPNVLQQLQAIEPYPVVTIVRLPDDSRTLIKQYLDIGAQTLMVPMIETVEQARRVVEATRYPPTGTRGVGAGLARVSRWSRVPDYLQVAATEIFLILQVESRAGLNILDDLAKMEGVDGIFIGPADLAADMGFLGCASHLDVVDAVCKGLECIAGHGKAGGVMALDDELAATYLSAGASFVAVVTDTGLLAKGAEAALKRFRSTL